MIKIAFLLIIFITISTDSIAENLAHDCSNELATERINDKLWTVNLTGIGIITTWGLVNWDYFENSPKSNSEGWFGNDTQSGGADKLGHLYTSYVITHGLSNLYDSWCINRNDAAVYGALSSLMIVGFIEIGDSFSEFGFSKEDLVANGIGIIYGYFSYKDQRLADILDIRWEYKPNRETLGDFATDYENSKYLLALKLNGFNFSQGSFIKYLEFHTGYYTRGFSEIDTAKERNIFIGIGINLTDLFRRHSYVKTSTLLKYYQVPGSNVTVEHDLNE